MLPVQPRVVPNAAPGRYFDARRQLRWRIVAWTTLLVFLVVLPQLKQWGPLSALVEVPLFVVVATAHIGAWLLGPASDTFRIP
jgi:hypothetical protein